MFCKKWVPSDKIIRFCESIMIPTKFFVFLVGTILAVFSFNAVWMLVNWIYKRLNETDTQDDIEETPLIMPLIICFISAFGIITVCSKSSFLYPYNDWYDPNCFLQWEKE